MFFGFVLSNILAYRRYRETIRKYSRFTDHQLEDVGIARFEIDKLARRSAL